MKKRLIGMAGVAMFATVMALGGCGNPEKAVFDREAPSLENADVTLSVNAAKGDTGISDSLFGVFLEDINYASYLLDDNLLANGSFDAITQSKNYAWAASGGAALAIENTDSVFKATAYAGNANRNYAKVTATVNGKLTNSGYTAVPMAVKEGTDYKFTAFIKNPDKALTMTVKITNGSEDFVVGTVEILQESSWVKYERTFTATGTASKNLKFELSFSDAATLCLDGVSFETSDSVCGIKKYVYDAVAELSPKFVRFPGGCIIEGNGAVGEECAYDWKNSVGAAVTGSNAGDDDVPAFSYKINTDGTVKDGAPTYGEAITRKHNPDLWAGSGYYDMDYAIGFYEYFVFAESIGASAVPVLNCGLSCQGGAASKPHGLAGRHNKGVNDYIRDAIDLLDFAKGGTDTKWGKIRASMGHPEPFEMDYLGIGNEQSGKYYTDYYEKFLEDKTFMAAMEKYGVKPIVGNAMHFENCENPLKNQTRGTAGTAAWNYLDDAKVNPDRIIETVAEYGVVDQHYYVNYTELFENAAMYDGYKREGENGYYEVFVGEYSANEGSGRAAGYDKHHANSWITALSEAAMMTGYERNGDVVKLAAYAPMFASLNWDDRQWKVDMMYYTNTEILRTANYYIQQIFMKNQGAYLPTAQAKAEYAADFETQYELPTDANSSAKPKTVDKIYHVESIGENGDVILKIVNASPDTIKTNFTLGGVKLKGNAAVTEIACDDWTATNTPEATPVKPESFTIGAFSKNTIGYELKPYSVVVIRVHTK